VTHDEWSPPEKADGPADPATCTDVRLATPWTRNPLLHRRQRHRAKVSTLQFHYPWGCRRNTISPYSLVPGSTSERWRTVKTSGRPPMTPSLSALAWNARWAAPGTRRRSKLSRSDNGGWAHKRRARDCMPCLAALALRDDAADGPVVRLPASPPCARDRGQRHST